MLYTQMLRWVSLGSAILASLWFSTSLLDPFNIPKLSILLVGAAALLGLLIGRPQTWFKRSEWPVWSGVSIFILGLTAAAFASDQHIYRTLWGAWARNNGWLAYASLAVIALAVALSCRGKDARYGLWSLIAVGYIQVLYGLLQTTGNDPVQWNNGYNPILGTVGNPNFASALLGMSAVAMLWSALDKGTWVGIRAGNATVAIIAVWLTIRSDSIQGTLAFAAGLAVLGAAWLSAPERRLAIRRLLIPYVTLGTVGFGVGVWGLTGNGPLGSILYSQNLVNRTYYWRAGWNMFKQDPLFGIGLDSYGDWYRLVRLPEQVAATGAQTVSNAAHSVVFQMLGTGGIAMFGTYLLLQILAVWRGITAIKRGQDPLLVGALFGVWLAFLLQSLFSIDQLGLTVWGWVIAGLLLAVSYEGTAATATMNRRKQRSRAAKSENILVPLSLAGVLGIGALFWAAMPLSIESRIRLAVAYTYDPQQPNPSVQQGIQQSVLDALEGANDPYWLATGINKLYAIGAVEEGIKLAETSAKAFPNDLLLWNLAATGYEQTNRAASAVPWRERTVELDPLNSDYANLLAQDKVAK